MKLVFFDKLNLNGLSCNAFGTVKWHPIVAKEIGDWIGKYKRGQRDRKIAKFGLEVVEKALKIAQENTCDCAPIDLKKSSDSFRQYRAIASEIESGSAEPHLNDLKIIYDAIETDACMMTNDDIIQKIGEKLIGSRSFKLKTFIEELIKDGTVTSIEVDEFRKTLAYYGERF